MTAKELIPLPDPEGYHSADLPPNYTDAQMRAYAAAAVAEEYATSQRLRRALERVKLKAISLADAQVIALEALRDYPLTSTTTEGEQPCAVGLNVRANLPP